MNSNDMNNAPLPSGWIQQVDHNSGNVFYVDTRANPPRSSWTHPFEDGQFLNEHPDARTKLRGSAKFTSSGTFLQKKGFFRKVKDKAKISFEEHNERKRQQRGLQQQQMQRLYGPGASTAPFHTQQHAYPQASMAPGMFPEMMGQRRRGGDMGGMALPMAGGFAGGLLMGDMLGNGHDGGSDHGGDFGDF